MNKSIVAAAVVGALLGVAGKAGVDSLGKDDVVKVAPEAGPCCGPNAKNQAPCGCSDAGCLPQEC